MKGRGIGWLIFAAACGVALLFLLTSHFARAHDHNRPSLNGWYQSLNSGRGPCCDGSDHKHLSDVDWEVKDKRYRVRIEGQWIDVPDDAVLPGPNLDGRTLVWPMTYLDGSLHVRCFLPGSMT